MTRLVTNLTAFAVLVGTVWFLACTIPFIISMTFALADGSDRVGNAVTGIRIRETLADWWSRIDLRVEQPPQQPRVVYVPRPVATLPPMQTGPSQQPAAPANPGGSCGTRIDDRQPVVNQYWQVPGTGWRIFNAWTNQPGFDQQERKLLLAPGENPDVLLGGSLWEFCNEQDARVNFASNRFTAVTLEQLRREGLSR